MKTNPTMNHPIHQLSALIGAICGLILLPLTVFAENKVVTSSLTESGTSYNDSNPTLPALSVSGNGVLYDGTNITLSATTTSGDASAVGKGVYLDNGARLSLTDSAINTTGGRGHGFYFTGTSSGTVSNVNIQAKGDVGFGGIVEYSSTLTLAGGSINTSGSGGRGILFRSNSSGTLSNVNIKTTGDAGYGVHLQNSTLMLTGGTISTTGSAAYGFATVSSSGTLSDVNIKTTGDGAHGVYENGFTILDSDISTTGSGANALHVINGSNRVNLNNNTLSGTGADSYSIFATVGTLTLTGSNGSVITGNVRSQSNARVDIILDGAGTELHGNFLQDATGVINLTLGTDALLDGGGTVTSLTLANDITIGYTGVITVTDYIKIDGIVNIDLSNLTATGEYNILDWSGAGTVDMDAATYNFTGAEGDFTVQGTKLVFNATAIPEPSTYFLLGAGLGILLLTARCRRQARTDA